ncbi:MAG: hypothetical protein ACI9VR_003688, partial [Cognaticolwellia sp.]
TPGPNKVSMLLFFALSLLACEDPSGLATVRNDTPEGLTVQVELNGVSEADLAGHTVPDGSIQTRLAQLEVSLNEPPIQGPDK